jgi:hypothetical protein
MSGWVRRFEAPAETVYCPQCGNAANFNFEFGTEGRTVKRVFANCGRCGAGKATYEIITDFRRAYDYGEYVAELVLPPEKNPGEGMTRTVRRLGTYT